MEKENPLVNKFLKQISKIIDHKLEKLTTVESAIVDQVNLDGTVNLHIPPDSTTFTNVQNQSIYQDLQVGDCVKVLKQNNKASNMWIVGGHDLKRPKNIEPFKGVDYIIEQGTSGDWTYRKWASGIAECWGVHPTSFNCKTNIGNCWFTDWLGVHYPTGLFLEPTKAIPVASCADNWSWLCMVQSNSNNSVVFRGVRSSNYTTVYDTAVTIHVIGTWK